MFFDIHDLLEYIKHNVTLSGIQRVAVQLLRYADAHTKGKVIPSVICGADRNTLQVFPMEALLNVLDEMESGNVKRAALDEKLALLNKAARIETPPAGGAYFIPGAYWIIRNLDFLMRWRGNGGRVYIFIHDLRQQLASRWN
jgi:hypothetical protein